MTPKQRVRAALHRSPADRIPIFMWFHPETAVALGQTLDIPPSAVADALGNDIRQTWVGNNAAMEGVVHEHDGETHTDAWGITWVKEGPFNQVLRSPLAGQPDAVVRAYRFPYDAIEMLLGNMEPLLASSSEYFLGCDISPCLFELLCRIRGMEETTFDLAAQPEVSSVLLGNAATFGIALATRACDRFSLDWLWTGDDVAGQESMIMSPTSWREKIRPHLERIVAVGREHGLPVAYHCCGAIRPIIPDLIEIGVTVLNPVQTTCPGMDPAELKAEFGNALTFMGGIDTQHLLPHGSTDEVYRETSKLIEIMASDGGGYILSASHTVPPETPIDSIFAVYAAAHVSREAIFDRAADIRAKSRVQSVR